MQHIPAVFSKAFAERLNGLCPFTVREAQDGDELAAGLVLIAPGGRQMRVIRLGERLVARIEDSPPVNRHKPSVDVLFDSITLLPKTPTIAALLTGMGADGAQGLVKLKQWGARTIAQDENSCVVFGMPKEAIRLDGVEKICALGEIAAQLVLWSHPKRSKSAVLTTS